MAFLKLKGFSKLPNARENYAVSKNNTTFPKGTNGRSVDLPITVNGKKATIRFSDASTYSGSNDWNGYIRFGADGLPNEFPKGAISADPKAETKFGDIEFFRGFDPRAYKGVLAFDYLSGTSPEADPKRLPKNAEAEARRVASYKANRAETAVIAPKAVTIPEGESSEYDTPAPKADTPAPKAENVPEAAEV